MVKHPVARVARNFCAKLSMYRAQPFQCPDRVENCDCVVCKRIGITDPALKDPLPVFQRYKLMKVYPNRAQVLMTDIEIADFESQHEQHAEWAKPYKETMWYKSCLRIINNLLKHKWAAPFKVPVDWKRLNIPDYPKVVRHPMDLGTVLRKLQGEEYTHPQQFINDVRFVFRNTYVYNPQQSEIVHMGEKLSSTFESAVAQGLKRT